MKKIAAFLCTILYTASLFSCGSSSSSQGDGSGQMYDASLLNNPESLDPQFAEDESSNTVISNLYSGLMTLDSSGNVVCRNASEYEISPDGLTYTFSLREDNYWFIDTNDNDKIEEGEYFPVVADDYVFAFRRILDPEMHSPYAEEFSCIKGGRASVSGAASPEEIGVTAADSHTLVIQLEHPSAEFLRLLATNAAVPCNEDFFLSTKGRYGLDDKSVMSNGAFFVRQWFYDPYGKNNILYMKRNSVNSNDEQRVYPSYLSFTIERSFNAIAELFKDEDIDCLTTLDRSRYKSSKYDVNPVRSITLGLIFNDQDETCSNKNLRKALAYSIDRETVSEKINDDVAVACGIIPPAVNLLGRSYRELTDDNLFGLYDESAAAEYMKKAKRELNAETLAPVKILVSTETVDSSYLHIVTQHWQDVLGSYIGIEEVTSEEFEQRLAEGDYQIALYPLTGEYNSGISVLEELCGNELIKTGSSSELIVKNLRECGDAASLTELFADAEKQLLSEFSFVPVFYKNSYLITQKECADIMYDPFSGAVDFKAAKYFD